MNLTYRHLSEQDMQDICAWRYEEDYALYNLPDYHEMKQRQMVFLILHGTKTSTDFGRKISWLAL